MSAIMKITSNKELSTDYAFYSYSTITFFEDAYTVNNNLLYLYNDFNLIPHWIEYKNENPIYCYMLNDDQYKVISNGERYLRRMDGSEIL